MPGSLARPPQHEHRDKGEEIELTCELAVKQGRRSWRRHIGAATVVVERPPSRGCDGEERHHAHGREAKHNTWRRRRGCRLSSNRWGDEGATASTERRGQKLQQGQLEQIKPRGRDPLGGARRRWRRMEARSTNPHGQMEANDEAERLHHRAAAELTGARRNQTRESSAIQDRQRED
jgi:hypothetical protein